MRNTADWESERVPHSAASGWHMPWCPRPSPESTEETVPRSQEVLLVSGDRQVQSCELCRYYHL